MTDPAAPQAGTTAPAKLTERDLDTMAEMLGVRAAVAGTPPVDLEARNVSKEADRLMTVYHNAAVHHVQRGFGHADCEAAYQSLAAFIASLETEVERLRAEKEELHATILRLNTSEIEL